MGMSASQARLLSITSRMSDVEYKSEQISQSKIRMSQESQQITAEYNEALSRQEINYKYFDGNDYVTALLTPALIAANSSTLGIKLYKNDGTEFLDPDNKISSSDLYEMICNGQVYIKDIHTGDRVDIFTNTSYRTSYNENESRKAEANYEAELAKINQKEKMLDFELDNLQTEHNALKAEMDAIKSLIKDNVEKSFNIFS